ncbi:hypothetical protein [Pseudomonas cerasi]
MRTWALVSEKKVMDVIAWDGVSDYKPPENFIVVEFDIDGESAPGIGWGYDGKKFIPPAS